MRPRGNRNARALWLALATLPATRSALADPTPHPSVAIVEPAPSTAALADAARRLRLELEASGFQVGGDGSGPGICAVIVLGETDERLTAELTPRCAPEGASVALRVDVSRAELAVRSPAARLAVRTAELARASFSVPVGAEPRPAAIRSGEPALVAVAQAPEPESEGGGELDAGVLLVRPTSAIDPVAAPFVRFAARVRGGLGAGMTIAGLGSSPRIEADGGSAKLGYTIALAELTKQWRAHARVRPMLGLTVGAARVSVAGEAGTGFRAHDGARNLALVGALLGVEAGLSRRAALFLDGGPLFALPRMDVVIGDATITTAAEPQWVLRLSVVAKL